MKSILSLIKQNRASGLSVSIVSICLSIPLAIASGATPLQGLLAAIRWGSVAALFGGSNYNVIGPAGALSGLLLVASAQLGAEWYGVLTIMIGLLIMAFWLTGMSKYITLIPSTALHGFMMWVGLIIGFSQLNNALWLFGLPKHHHMIQNISETFHHINEISWIAVLVFLWAFCFLKIWTRWIKSIPAVLPVTILGIIVGIITHKMNLWLLTLNDQFPSLSFSLMEGWVWEKFLSLFLSGSEWFDKGFAIAALAFPIAVVAVLETIISAKVADKQTKTKHHQSNEVRGLWLANAIGWVMGAMPVTWVFVRTALNIKSGANSRMSSFINTIFVVLISWLLFPYFVYLPLAVTAAILINLALGMIDIKLYKKILSVDTKSFWLVMIVGLVTWLEDPIYGIILWTIAALLMYIRDASEGDLMVNVFRNNTFHKRRTIKKYLQKQEEGDIIVIKLPHDMTFLNAGSEIEHIQSITKASHYIISCSQLQYADMDALEWLEDIIESLQKSWKERYVTGLWGRVEAMIRKFHCIQDHHQRIFSSTSLVLNHLSISW
jgi:sulfate permease, SulP family